LRVFDVRRKGTAIFHSPPANAKNFNADYYNTKN
jgi:hypothetical protein